MMGPRQVDQAALFYEFSLERHVPASHLLKSIDRFVELSDVRSHLAPFYSSTGRPSIDPELLVRMLLVGYCYDIRSERRLCEEVHLNLAYRWFCRLGPDGEVADHSTFSKNRHGRFRDCNLLRKLFEIVVRRCMAEGLVDGAAFAVDASLIAADANKQRSAAGSDDVDWEAIARTRRALTKDRRSQRTCLLCLRRQLADRPEGGDHRRCRGDASYPAGRGRCGTHND
jgi:transposase